MQVVGTKLVCSECVLTGSWNQEQTQALQQGTQIFQEAPPCPFFGLFMFRRAFWRMKPSSEHTTNLQGTRRVLSKRPLHLGVFEGKSWKGCCSTTPLGCHHQGTCSTSSQAKLSCRRAILCSGDEAQSEGGHSEYTAPACAAFHQHWGRREKLTPQRDPISGPRGSPRTKRSFTLHPCV